MANSAIPAPTPPSWLTADFLEEALKNKFQNKNIKISNCEIKMAAAVGDHYGSQMFRCNLVFENNEKFSVVVKSCPVNALTNKLDVTDIFVKEIEAYSTTLPAIDSQLEKVYPTDERLWAQCYHYGISPNCVLVLEDLRPEGFTLGERFNGLDMDHAVLVIKALAKLHAGSLAVSKDIVEKHSTNMWRSKSEVLQSIIINPFNGMLNDIPNWPDFENKNVYLEKLKNIENEILDRIHKVWQTEDSKLNVLLHGDSWVNNFMFKYDQLGNPIGVKLVDFQIMGFSSPVIDLQYFVFTSVKPELKIDGLEQFFETYCETFNDTVNKLGINVTYTLEDIHKDFEKKCFWGFIVMCSLYPLVSAPAEDMFDPEDYFKNDKELNFSRVFKRETVKNIIKNGFKFFEQKGAF